MSRTHKSSTAEKFKAAEDLRRRIFSLACEMEEPLAQALAFAGALDLMGFGLRNIADDHGVSLLAIVEALTDELKAAKMVWQKLLAASGHTG